MVPTLLNKRRNCKKCSMEGKKDYKSTYMCEKCDVPLHIACFKQYHVPVM
jgi:hypothetical protein